MPLHAVIVLLLPITSIRPADASRARRRTWDPRRIELEASHDHPRSRS